MDLQAYYTLAESGEPIDNSEILSLIKSYKNIVLWGASYLGKVLGKHLQEHGIVISSYWDARYNEINSVNGVSVKPSFDESLDKQNTLVILCIGNTAIRGSLLAQLSSKGFMNVIFGDKLFMGLVCPFNKETGINGITCNGSMTCRSMFCSKLHNIVRARNDKKGLFIPNLTFMITSHCSLKCKYCVAYMNSYPNEKRRHIPYEQIERDIDCIFDSVDSVGSVTIQGGEPFLHPDIGKIVEKMLSKSNLGIVSVATNGIFKIDESMLDKFRDHRLNVAFSGYYDALPQEKLDIYYQNIELMKKKNVPHTVGVKVPEWIIPPTLWDKNYSEEVMKHKKTNCKLPERCMQVMDGKLYPCLFSVSLHGIGVADYPGDYVNLQQENLTDRISEYMNRPYYDSCGHCGGGGTTGMAGEQGYYDFVNPS